MSAIGDKKNPQWLKFRKQKIAFEARLRKRRQDVLRKDSQSKLDEILQFTIAIAIDSLPSDKVSKFKADV